MTVYLCVDKDGTEKVSNTEPIRRKYKNRRIFSVMWGLATGNYTKNNCYKWCDGFSTDSNDFLPFSGTILPKGSIYKLTGKNITWDDYPIELKIKK